MWALAGAMVALGVGMAALRHFFHGFQPFGPLPFWLIGPAIAAVQRRPKIETLAVSASPEGLVLGEKIVPRAKLKSAMLRREGDRTFVLLRGAGSMGASADVEVKNDDEADRLCTALALDAKSTTAEFALQRSNVAIGKPILAVMIAFIITTFAAIRVHALAAPLVILGLAILLAAVGVPLLAFHHRVKLRVGADGLLVKEGLLRSRFVAHDEIEAVRALDNAVMIVTKHGTMTFDVGAAARGKRNKKKHVDLASQAESIAWRIEKAREAYRALAGNAPQAALALDRGGKTVREWIDQLRRVGEGANATFRDVGLTREQLLRVVESTTAAAKERLAAAVALRAGLTEEEKPRIRVAADRCVEPAMRDRMVRVAFADDDEMIEEALSAADAQR
jgi:hypothetical protein